MGKGGAKDGEAYLDDCAVEGQDSSGAVSVAVGVTPSEEGEVPVSTSVLPMTG